MKNKWIVPLFSGGLFLLLVLMVKMVDVAAIGPEGSSVGLSHLNGAFRDLVGLKMPLYQLTQVLGYLAIGIGGIFAALGLVQLIQRKSLFRVDPEILTLGGLYVVLGLLYVLFEVAVVNYRPVILPGEELEASFPSSHTMLACVVLGGVMIILDRYLRSDVSRVLRVVCGVMMVVLAGGRLLSGVHWLTDILGGVLLSVTLLSLFALAIPPKRKRRGRKLSDRKENAT